MGNIGKARSITGLLAFAALAMAGTNARADATLTLTPVSSECVSTTLGSNGFPTTTITPCAPPVGTSTRPIFDRGGGVVFREGSFLRLVYDFTYTDDGLPLSAPTVLDPSLPSALASFEAGILLVSVQGVTTPSDPGLSVVISVPDGAIDAHSNYAPYGPGYAVFGLNDRPDQLSGRLYVTVGVPAIGVTTGTIAGVSVSTSVAAVPEPSTYALSLAGLLALALAARRRQRTTGGGAATSTAMA